MFLQTEMNVARKNFLVVLWCSYSNTTVEKQISYRKIFTSETDIQHVKLDFCKVHYF